MHPLKIHPSISVGCTLCVGLQFIYFSIFNLNLQLKNIWTHHNRNAQLVISVLVLKQVVLESIGIGCLQLHFFTLCFIVYTKIMIIRIDMPIEWILYCTLYID